MIPGRGLPPVPPSVSTHSPSPSAVQHSNPAPSVAPWVVPLLEPSRYWKEGLMELSYGVGIVRCALMLTHQ